MPPVLPDEGEGGGRAISVGYLLLVLALGPGAAGTGVWYFSQDAREMVDGLRTQREQAIDQLEDRVTGRLLDQHQSFLRDMEWRDRQRQDHEERLRALERAIYGRQEPQRPYGYPR
jgi:hypothetical protein